MAEMDMVEKVFRVESTSFTGDSLEAYRHGDQVTIEIDEPWAGSTETGFGQTCSIGLSLSEAKRFYEWLGAALSPVTSTEEA